ncbi:MAG: hypothetical protein CMN71_13785 [Sphingomonadaceae bacterium]|nr:hypothetical protein [Sphingomonadaceae bacterium]
MVESLRGKATGLVHYAWRADLRELATAAMETAVDAYHTDLLRYVRREGHKEEVAATLTRNLRSEEAGLIAAEMGALIEDADPPTDIVEHYIISVREGERFGEHLDKAVDTLMKGLGLENCPAVAALHRDTDNEHIHLVVLRIDKDTGEIVDPLKYDIIRAHQMLAVLEEQTGWSREKKARWQVQNGRLVLDGETDIGSADDPSSWPDRYYPDKELSSASRTKEAKTGIESGERIVRRVVPGLIVRHEKLPDLLEALQREGISLSKKGSGAVYRVTTKGTNGEARAELVRCSVIRRWSYGKLREKYGELPEEFGSDDTPREPRPIDGSPDRPRYAAMRAEYLERLNAITRNVRMAMPRNADLNEAIASGRRACVFPTLEAWRNGELPFDPGEVMFAHVGARIFEAPDAKAPKHVSGQPDALFMAIRSGRRTIYQRREAPMAAARLVDFGNRVVLIGPAGENEVKKTMALFAERGDKVVSAAGLDKTEWRMAARIAASHGITLVAADPHQLGVGQITVKGPEGDQLQRPSPDRTVKSGRDSASPPIRTKPRHEPDGSRNAGGTPPPMHAHEDQAAEPSMAEIVAWQQAEDA